MTDVLEHVPDDFTMFSAVAAALQPGAYLLITVPADMRLWTGHDESFGHYRRYDARRFAKIWDELPIEPLLVSHFNRRLYPLIKGVRAVNRLRADPTVSLASREPTSRFRRGLSTGCLENIFAGEARVLCRALKSGGTGYLQRQSA